MFVLVASFELDSLIASFVVDSLIAGNTDSDGDALVSVEAETEAELTAATGTTVGRVGVVRGYDKGCVHCSSKSELLSRSVSPSSSDDPPASKFRKELLLLWPFVFLDEESALFAVPLPPPTLEDPAGGIRAEKDPASVEAMTLTPANVVVLDLLRKIPTAIISKTRRQWEEISGILLRVRVRFRTRFERG